MKYQNDTSHNSTGLATVWPQDFMQDLRYGWRILRRTPGFALVAVLTIALGIGASSAVFTVINTFFLNSLPIPNPSTLEAVYAMPESADPSANTPQPISFLDLQDYREKNKVFTELAGYSSPMPISFSEGKGADRLFAELVTGNYFETLGLAPVLGRFPGANEDRSPGSDPVIVIGYGMWQRRFGGSLSAIGRLIYVNERPFTIIGVAPSGPRRPIGIKVPNQPSPTPFLESVP